MGQGCFLRAALCMVRCDANGRCSCAAPPGLQAASSSDSGSGVVVVVPAELPIMLSADGRRAGELLSIPTKRAICQA